MGRAHAPHCAVLRIRTPLPMRIIYQMKGWHIFYLLKVDVFAQSYPIRTRSNTQGQEGVYTSTNLNCRHNISMNCCGCSNGAGACRAYVWHFLVAWHMLTIKVAVYDSEHVNEASKRYVIRVVARSCSFTVRYDRKRTTS